MTENNTPMVDSEGRELSVEDAQICRDLISTIERLYPSISAEWCTKCGGRGHDDDYYGNSCSVCHGDGKAPTDVTVYNQLVRDVLHLWDLCPAKGYALSQKVGDHVIELGLSWALEES